VKALDQMVLCLGEGWREGGGGESYNSELSASGRVSSFSYSLSLAAVLSFFNM
jgi:hypothetical protein